MSAGRENHRANVFSSTYYYTHDCDLKKRSATRVPHQGILKPSCCTDEKEPGPVRRGGELRQLLRPAGTVVIQGPVANPIVLERHHMPVSYTHLTLPTILLV